MTLYKTALVLLAKPKSKEADTDTLVDVCSLGEVELTTVCVCDVNVVNLAHCKEKQANACGFRPSHAERISSADENGYF